MLLPPSREEAELEAEREGEGLLEEGREGLGEAVD